MTLPPLKRQVTRVTQSVPRGILTASCGLRADPQIVNNWETQADLDGAKSQKNSRQADVLYTGLAKECGRGFASDSDLRLLVQASSASLPSTQSPTYWGFTVVHAKQQGCTLEPGRFSQRANTPSFIPWSCTAVAYRVRDGHGKVDSSLNNTVLFRLGGEGFQGLRYVRT